MTSELDPIDRLFDRLNAWRHLPAYQLERRADIFFAVYLQEALESVLGTRLSDTIIPELPIKRDLIWPDRPTNKSVKVDYCLFSAERDRVFFVELKTDVGSRRSEQDEYLTRAVDVGFHRIVGGIREIALASTANQKYHHLLHSLASEEFMILPDDLPEFLYPAPRPGLSDRLEAIAVADRDPAIEVFYVQPTSDNTARCIDFDGFAKIVERHHDPVSRAFAASLRRWQQPAGARPPGT